MSEPTKTLSPAVPASPSVAAPDMVRGGWAVEHMTGRFTISHPYMAQAPGCPRGPHPTRTCGCKPFRTRAEADTYIDVTVEESGGKP